MDKRIITAPDDDLREAWRIMLVDFDLEAIQQALSLIEKIPHPVSLFLYGGHDLVDPLWCFRTARSCNAVLVNLEQVMLNELVKGRLLAMPHVSSIGDNALATNKYNDIVSFISLQWHKFEQENNE